MIVDNLEDFNVWVVSELTAMGCDAEPTALAKYVLALLRKPDKSAEELRQFSADQLAFFLQHNTVRFVDKMFTVLKNKSYIQSSTTSSAAPEPVSTPVKSKEKEVKVEPATSRRPLPASTSVSENAEHDSEKVPNSSSAKVEESRRRAPIQAPVNEKRNVPKDEPSASEKKAENGSSRFPRKRISPPPQADGKEKSAPRETREGNYRRRGSRSPQVARANSRERRQRGPPGPRRSSPSERYRPERRRSPRSRSRSPERERRDRNSEKRKCKDFEKKGVCFRGDQCPYDHGMDPVVIVDETALGKIVPQNPNFSVPPPGYTPMNPPPPGVAVENLYVPNAVEGYNPEAPSIAPNFSFPPPPLQMPMSNAWRGQPFGMQNANPNAMPYNPQGIMGNQSQAQPMRGGIRGRGRVRGARGYQNVGNRSFEPATLQVKKVPPELNTIAKLNEHFASFGVVENIQVRYNGEPDSALITYSTRRDAQKAHQSPTPVLNNRFIKVFWHNAENQNSEPGSAMQQNNAGSVYLTGGHSEKMAEKPKIATRKESKFVSAEQRSQRAKLTELKDRFKREQDQLKVLIDLQKRKSELLEKLMNKQKSLITKAKTSTDDGEKKMATKLVKQVYNKIKLCKQELDDMLLSISDKSQDLEELSTQLDALKSRKIDGEAYEELGEGRKRKADSDVDSGVDPKISGTIVVQGIKSDDISELMTHMEKFGETFDMNVTGEAGDLATATIPYRNFADAQRAFTEGKILNGTELNMKFLDRSQSEVLTTDADIPVGQLLAAIPAEADSDDDNEY